MRAPLCYTRPQQTCTLTETSARIFRCAVLYAGCAGQRHFLGAVSPCIGHCNALPSSGFTARSCTPGYAK